MKMNKFIGKVLGIFNRFIYWIFGIFKYNILFNIKRWLRIHKVKGFYERYEGLLEYKNRHNGERCFIVATGPSLRISDLDMLKNEICFSVNTIFKAFEDTDWRPTYYTIQDHFVYNQHKDKIDKISDGVKQKFFSDWLLEKCSVQGNIFFPTNVKDNYLLAYKKVPGFSDDCFDTVYASTTIVYSTMQLAVYMGFKEIYLLGCDCNFSGPQKHFKTDINEERDFVKSLNDVSKYYERTYNVAKQYTESHNIKIFNATRGGSLEVFERVNLDELLENT